MSYVVLARKYRPQTFEDLIGQGPVATTLSNAIVQKRIAHAYLFSGPRGVGKTSTARIFAKALNCEKGPTSKQCNACAVCREITEGRSLDVLEIDGASNRGIDEVRELRENVKFSPSRGRFKVYIIDEVHMLTPEAFNALLKTLEEPPAHVKFVFATTAPHKVPATILSRCQRFDFHKVKPAEIVKHLDTIAKAEKLQADPAALRAIAAAADGSLRDAQSLLDQLASFTAGRIEESHVAQMFGWAEDALVLEACQALADRNAEAALKLVGKLFDQGKDPSQFLLRWMEMLRELLVLKVSSAPEIRAEVSGAENRLEPLVAKFSTEEILSMLETLLATQDYLRRTGQARLPIELAAIKLVQRRGSSQPAPVPAPPSAPPRPVPQVTPLPRGGGARPVPPADLPSKPAPRAQDGSNGGSAPQDEPAPPPVAVDQAAPAFEAVESAWGEVVVRVKREKMSCGSFLENARPRSMSGRRLQVGLPKTFVFYKENLEKPDNRKLIERILHELLGAEVWIDFGLVDPPPIQAPEAPPSAPSSNSPAPSGPLIDHALDIFKGRIRRVH